MAKFIHRLNNSKNPVQPDNEPDINAKNTELFGKLLNGFLTDSKAPESEQSITLAFTRSFLEQRGVSIETTRSIIASIETLNTDTLKSNDVSFMQAAIDLVREISKLPDNNLDYFISELHEHLEKKNKRKGQTLL